MLLNQLRSELEHEKALGAAVTQMGKVASELESHLESVRRP